MKTHSLALLHIVSALVFVSGTAWSGTTVYFNQAKFRAACQGLAGVRQQIAFSDFSDSALFSTTDYSPPRGSVTISGVTFRGRYLMIGPVGLWNYDGAEPLTIHCDKGAKAFGALLSSNGESSKSEPFYSNFTANITLDTGETFSFPGSAAPGSTFFGVVATDTITNLTFSDGGALIPNGLHEESIESVYLVVNSVPLPSVRLFLQPEFQNAGLEWPVTNAGFLAQQSFNPNSTNWTTIGMPQPPFSQPTIGVQIPYPTRPTFYRLILNQW